MVVPCIKFFNFAVGFAYPVAATFRTLEHQRGGSTSGTNIPLPAMQWTAYWVLYTTWNLVERYLIFFCTPYIPFYDEMKFALFLWLVHPTYLGAAWLWENVIERRFASIDEKFVTRLEEYLASFMSFASSQSASTTIASKVEMVSDLGQVHWDGCM
eukprot:Polyplicarium_translucidae@DN3103_c0_g1_i2.p1